MGHPWACEPGKPAPEAARLLVVAGRGIEQQALRCALWDSAVICPRAAGNGGRQPLALRDHRGPVAAAGFCEAPDQALQPGDVVAATQLHSPAGSLALPAAPFVAAALRARGMPAHLGPVWSGPPAPGGPGVIARGLDAAAGLIGLAGDAAPSVGAAAGADRPVAALGVVARDLDQAIVPGVNVLGELGPYEALRRAAPVLATWAAAAGPKQVALASPRSYCAGVERAIQVVESALDRYGAPVYVRKQIVHNRHVVADLEARGAVFVDEVSEVPEGSVVVFSAHGVAPAVHTAAAGRRLRVIDATCPLVSKVHAEARRFAAEGRTILLIGHAGHEEVEGTSGEAPEAIVLVEDAGAAARVAVEDPGRVAYLTQTTLALDETAGIVAALKQRFPALQSPPSEDICYATQNRQDALSAIAGDVEVVFVVGSENSSNSRRLVELSTRLGTEAHLIDDEAGLDVAWLAGRSRIGITAGASASDHLVARVLAALRGLGALSVTEAPVAEESVRFSVPKEVR
jgi:4-hydroxy-3-methylbut-2-enyl diphosphate reductase